jgi:hypothetical protein
MPDITMCTGHGCEVKNDCYRYMAVPTPEAQLWQAFDPDDTEHCFRVARASHKLMPENWQDESRE